MDQLTFLLSLDNLSKTLEVAVYQIKAIQDPCLDPVLEKLVETLTELTRVQDEQSVTVA